MRYCLLITLLLSCGMSAFAQPLKTKSGKSDTTDKEAGNFICRYPIEQQPEFVGDLGKYISLNTHYPSNAMENNEQGKVYVQFAVLEDGCIDEVTILRGISPLLNEEAMRLVREMPRWKPGLENGKPFKSYYTMPIHFTLE